MFERLLVDSFCDMPHVVQVVVVSLQLSSKAAERADCHLEARVSDTQVFVNDILNPVQTTA